MTTKQLKEKIDLAFVLIGKQQEKIQKLEQTITNMDQWNAMDRDNGKLYRKGYHGVKG